MSHGYELKMTPLHTLTLFNSIANEGKMVQPIIVKYIKRADQVIQEFEAKILKEKICSESTLRDVKIMLQGVVERGTAQNIYTPSTILRVKQVLQKMSKTDYILTSIILHS